MARFRFNLQAVLDQRRTVERERQREVAVLERERARVEDLIRECQRGIERERRELRRHVGPGEVALRDARLQAASGARLVARAQQAVLELAGVHQRLERARVTLLEASRRRKAVEMLRERRFEEWRWEQNRLEDRAIDELAVMRRDGRGETRSPGAGG